MYVTVVAAARGFAPDLYRRSVLRVNKEKVGVKARLHWGRKLVASLRDRPISATEVWEIPGITAVCLRSHKSPRLRV